MKKFAIGVSGFLTYLSFPIIAFADNFGDPCGGTSDPKFKALCKLGQTGGKSIGEVIGTVVNLLFIVAAIVALIYLVLGGIKWVTSEGESKNVEAARNQIIAAAVGLGITFLSYFILNLLLTFLLGQGLTNVPLPSLQ